MVGVLALRLWFSIHIFVPQLTGAASTDSCWEETIAFYAILSNSTSHSRRRADRPGSSPALVPAAGAHGVGRAVGHVPDRALLRQDALLRHLQPAARAHALTPDHARLGRSVQLIYYAFHQGRPSSEAGYMNRPIAIDTKASSFAGPVHPSNFARWDITNVWRWTTGINMIL